VRDKARNNFTREIAAGFWSDVAFTIFSPEEAFYIFSFFIDQNQTKIADRKNPRKKLEDFCPNFLIIFLKDSS
jgi:hypothetical protein